MKITKLYCLIIWVITILTDIYREAGEAAPAIVQVLEEFRQTERRRLYLFPS